MVLSAHGEQEMEAVAEQVDVDLVGNHGAGHLGVGDKEDVLVGSAGEGDAVGFAHGAACSVASGNPSGHDVSLGTIGLLENGGDRAGLLSEADKFGAPLDRRSQLTKVVAHQAFVVV